MDGEKKPPNICWYPWRNALTDRHQGKRVIKERNDHRPPVEGDVEGKFYPVRMKEVFPPTIISRQFGKKGLIFTPNARHPH